MKVRLVWNYFFCTRRVMVMITCYIYGKRIDYRSTYDEEHIYFQYIY